eukprot:CAMPEP_0173348792 /NCGR_PEP_ID=MMETSP1144-20121109/13940_1 /TAXON_ID=483371 /ORGANISM="non described non described, Strain CCMP2298" /LENGTH=44 /DNA_ID= /DNA_START= /DNA_END= /DNA_ORIENTATION=
MAGEVDGVPVLGQDECFGLEDMSMEEKKRLKRLITLDTIKENNV